MEAGGGWCSTVIIVPSLYKSPIRATGRLHGPLKFVAFAQVLLLFACENLRVLPLASLAVRLHRSALRLPLTAHYDVCRLYYLCVFSGS